MAATSWRSKVALLLVSTTLTAVLAMVAGELFFRSRERSRTEPPGAMPLLFYPHQLLGHAMVRGYDYFGWVHVNSQGFRGPEVTKEKAPGTVRIMVVGGSTTFDHYVSGDDRTWPARLAAHLDELGGDRKFEVINAGVSGYRVLEDIIRLANEYPLYSPDAIVFLQGHNDLFQAFRLVARDENLARPGEVQPLTPWVQWLMRNSLLYGKVRGRFRVLAFFRRSGPRMVAGPEQVDEAEAAFDRNVNGFLAMARAMDIPVIVPQVVHVSGFGTLEENDPTRRTMWSNALPGVETARVLDAYARFNAVLESASAKQGAVFVPTSGFGLAGAQWYEAGDPIHFNDAGADRMALGMAEAMLALPLLDSLSAQASPEASEVP